MKDFYNKVVYITGGSSGIGLSTAKQLASRGAHVLIFARRKEILEKAVLEIQSKRFSSNQRIDFRQLDVSQYDDVKTVMSEAANEFGAPDILINSAGRAYPRRFEEVSYQQFDETMKINLYGIWNTIQALLPFMKAKGGYIVNISSIAGFIGVFGYSDYSASKFGVIGLSEVLRSELKQYNIRLSVLCPPDTDTPGLQIENMTKPLETKAISNSAKIMTPDQVACQLIRGMEKGKFMIIPSMDGYLTYLAKRFIPELVSFAISWQINKNKGCTLTSTKK